ncbi:MAG: glycosyltransferase family 4 protein [Gemmatimonadota bacterium]
MTIRKSVLVILPGTPWPIRANGLSVRYYSLLVSLAARCDVDVVITSELTVGNAVADESEVPPVRRVVTVAQVTAPSALDRVVLGLRVANPFGASFRHERHDTAHVARALKTMLLSTRYDAVHIVGWLNREAFDRVRSLAKGSRITHDMVDSPYLHYVRSTAPNTSRMSNVGWFRALDLWRTARWERSMRRNVDACVYVSLFDANAAGANSTSIVVPNGVIVERPSEASRAPERRAKCLGFLGNMAYPPNVLGALQLYHEVFLPLKKEFPELRLKIIGRDPDAAIQALASTDVDVTGTVDDVWPHVADVDLFVFPMTTGAGLQNKVLEVMYAAKPVVTTPICQQGVGATVGEHLLVGATPEAVRDLTRRALEDWDDVCAMGLRGSAFVRRTFAADEMVQRLSDIILPRADGSP